MKKTILVLCVFFPLIFFGQGFLTSKNIKVDFQVLYVTILSWIHEGMFVPAIIYLNFIPYRPVYDENGKDINKVANAHLLNTFSRFGTRFSGLEMGKAVVSAYIEVDFTGFQRNKWHQAQACLYQFCFSQINFIVWESMASYLY
jgi:hypothetical protein